MATGGNKAAAAAALAPLSLCCLSLSGSTVEETQARKILRTIILTTSLNKTFAVFSLVYGRTPLQGFSSQALVKRAWVTRAGVAGQTRCHLHTELQCVAA